MNERPRVLDTGYRARSQFVEYHKRKQRHGVLVAHRRAGKTVAAVNDLIDAAIRDKSGKGRYGYIAPLLKQAKEVAWDYVKQYTKPVAKKVNESDLIVYLHNGSRIRLYGADNPDSIRGGYFMRVVLDEYGDMRASLWGDVVRPMLSDYRGRATFIGTPKGRNDFYKMAERARMSDEWYYGCLRASETGILSPEELVEAREDMDDDSYQREYECDFMAAVQGAIFAKEMQQMDKDNRITKFAYDPRFPVVTGWDLGMRDATAIWFAQQVGIETRIIDYYEASGEALDHYVTVLQNKGYIYKQHILPHDVKARELGSGKSRYETLRGMGMVGMRILPNLIIRDGIEQARLLLRTCWINEQACASGIEALRLYRFEYDDARKVLSTNPVHDWTSHASDAFRYLAIGLRTSTQSVDKRTMKQVDNYQYGR